VSDLGQPGRCSQPGEAATDHDYRICHEPDARRQQFMRGA
jgi:hypothetical protein